jgi:hypothetical protein
MSEPDIGDDQEVVGLAEERSDLAWSRSGLAVVVCLAAIAKRFVLQLSSIDADVVVVAALAIGAIAWAFALFWGRVIGESTLAGRRVADARTLQAVALGTAALGVAAMILALLPDR